MYKRERTQTARQQAFEPKTQPALSVIPRIAQSSLSAIGVLILILAVLGFTLQQVDWLEQGSIALAFAIAAAGLGIALGLGGEFVLGITVIFAVSAYASAVLTTDFMWSFWPAALVGMLGSILVGVLFSLPGLRVSNFYFGMLGFFLVSLVPDLVQMFGTWTGGTNGLSVPALPDLFGVQLGANGMFLMATVALGITLLFSRNLRLSPLGTQMRRMRESAVMLATTGVPVWRIRLATYVISSVLAGLGGAVYSHLEGFLLPDDFSLDITTLILAAVIVGGSRSLLGPVIGVILLYVVPNVVISLQGYTTIIYGVLVVLSVLLFRGGLVQAATDLFRWLRSRRGGVRAASANTIEFSAPRSPETLADLLWGIRRDTNESKLQRALVVTGVRKRYGGVAALDFEDDDTITVHSGEVHLLLGPNGSGKTTVLNVISGLVRVDHGTVALDESDISELPVAKISRAGVCRSFQNPALPDEVTPVELFAAALAYQERVSYFHWFLGDPVAYRARKRSIALARQVADAAGIGAARDERCEKLTSGQRRIVDVVHSLLSSNTTIALLDEPAAGLSDVERTQLSATIRALAGKGLGFIVVEHDLDLALAIADTVTVMADGRPIADGTPVEIQESALAREVLLGGVSQ